MKFSPKLLNQTFNLKIYSRRWGHFDSYTCKITNSGWYFSFHGIGGRCNKKGHPYLFKNFRQDLICYPSDLSYVLEDLWDKVHRDKLNPNQITPKLKKIAKWISETEKNRPKWKIKN
ncbi:MAG: hypothetical protein KDD48_00135 [Bdellovibrionales bacterium]|nr:hypothetical protein [Bdellovibrionales bacterium]